MHLSHLTLTGADDATDIDQLAALSRQAPLLEWGIVMSVQHEGQPCFPSASWRERFLRTAPRARRAAHLRGQAMLEQMQAAVRPSASPLGVELRGRSNGHPNYGRVQLEFQADRMPLAAVAGVVADWRHGRWTRDDGTPLQLVTQHNLSNWSLHALFLAGGPPNVYPDWYAVLFDETAEHDWLPARWPEPLPGLRGGYAGGLDADNAAAQLHELASRLPDDATVWLDFRSGLRSNGRFDLREAAAVIDALQSVIGDAPLVPGVHIPAAVTA